ncbi:MAG: glutamate formiminotransferase [Actinobacteria bacterium]|nr:glutamate formiminotransferase [Actinomycetota bacterium]
MSLVVIPNVSEGRRPEIIQGLQASIEQSGAKVLDRHSDELHNRTVFTVSANPPTLIDAMESLAQAAASAINLETHHGRHPRLGALDVCPFVPVEAGLQEAIDLAREAGTRIGALGIPVYLYGAASASALIGLPDLRRGGLDELIQRAKKGDPPDMGPQIIEPRTGVVCVGARPPLIAFNVWLEGSVLAARSIASQVRDADKGLPGVRALGLDMGEGQAQVSMNLTDPGTTSIEDAFAAVEDRAGPLGVRVRATEIVGLPPERFMPPSDARVTRLLMQPGHSLESRLQKL